MYHLQLGMIYHAYHDLLLQLALLSRAEMGGLLGIKPTDPNVAMTQPKQSAEGTACQTTIDTY